jgi:phage-related tail protein
LSIRCAGTKRDGTPCTATVEPPQRFCWWHNPANADKRRRAASKAGKAKPNRELASIKTRLSDLADDVLAGEVDKGVAAVASQVLNVYLRAVSVELKAREQLELIERLESLEEGLEQQKGERRYGA